MTAPTMAALFQHTAAERPAYTALRTVDDSMRLTWSECASEVERLAGGLAGLGVGPGDPVALMLRNHPAFNLFDTAAVHLGPIPWSVYLTSAPAQITFMLARSGTRVVICDPCHADRVREALDGTQVEHVVVTDGSTPLPRPPGGFDFGSTWYALDPEGPVTLIWTSGTTGDPKPVELSHRALVATLRGITAVAGLEPGGRMVSYLPSAHTGDRLLSHYWWMSLGAELTCLPDASQVVRQLPAIRPTFWGAVPRIFEKMRAMLESRGITDPAALTPDEAEDVRHGLGLDQAELLMVGAAPLAVDTLRYFDALGLPLSEVWGMSETCGIFTLNPPGARRYGTVGPPLPGSQLRLAADGEVLVRGPQLMSGYRDSPDLTAEVLIDGWLHTGDIGTIDADGYLSIVDRKKEIIINAGGKNMSPALIENALKTAGPLIGQACVVGDRRPYNVALLVLDPDTAGSWAARHDLEGIGLAELSTNSTLLADVAAEVETANAVLSRVEQVKAWRVLPTDWKADSDELTPTMKLKRRTIADIYSTEIEDLYQDSNKDRGI